MSMFGNMMDTYKMASDLFGQNKTNADSFSGGDGGMSEIEQALMMQNLQQQIPNAMQGTMFGMPGAQQKSIAVDEMTPAPQVNIPSFGGAGGGGSGSSMGENMASTAMAMYAMFSDRRLKKNVQRIGQYKGHNIYRYGYLWDPDWISRVGVMAQEVPHAAFPHTSGYLMVDYSKI